MYGVKHSESEKVKFQVRKQRASKFRRWNDGKRVSLTEAAVFSDYLTSKVMPSVFNLDHIMISLPMKFYTSI